jgi:hypothetical protein
VRLDGPPAVPGAPGAVALRPLGRTSRMAVHGRRSSGRLCSWIRLGAWPEPQSRCSTCCHILESDAYVVVSACACLATGSWVSCADRCESIKAAATKFGSSKTGRMCVRCTDERRTRLGEPIEQMDNDPVVSRTVIDFNSVYVIESLPDGDFKTGQDLYDSIVFPESVRLEGLHTEFAVAKTKDELARRLALISRNAKLGNHKPIIHIEAHGTDDGIALADGSVMDWRTLIPFYGDINQSCKMNLIVVAISCMGWNLAPASASGAPRSAAT